MALVGDWEKIEDGRLLKNYLDSAANFLDQVDSRVDLIIAMKSKYPSDVTELNGYLNVAKNRLNTLITKINTELGT